MRGDLVVRELEAWEEGEVELVRTMRDGMKTDQTDVDDNR